MIWQDKHACYKSYESNIMKYRQFIQSLKKSTPKSIKLLYHRIKYYAGALRYRSVELLFRKEDLPFYCPCCNLHLKSFISLHYENKTEYYDPARYETENQNVICPLCHSLPRHRILALWCEKHKELLHDSDILYFALEKGMAAWLKRNGISVTTADLNNKANLKIDIQNTNLPDESYDFIICNHVLEHVADYNKALYEIFRILRPGGYLICSFPMDQKINLVDETDAEISEKEHIQRYGQFDHNRVFGMNAGSLLADSGYIVTEINGKDYPDEILPVPGPADYDANILFLCQKPK